MRWGLASGRADRRAARLADRHYSRKSPGSPQFAAPGRLLVLVTEPGDAVWVTLWPLPEYTTHGLGDVWLCTIFRNEGQALSSELIREAVAATRWRWPESTAEMITFVDAGKVRPKRDPGRCFLRAGFTYVRNGDGSRRRTKDRGLLVLRLARDDMPSAEAPIGASMDMPWAVPA